MYHYRPILPPVPMFSRQHLQPGQRLGRQEPRRWLLPAAMLRGVGETLEGAVVLDEFKGDLGVALWQSVRDVRLWAEVAPAHRVGLLRAAARALTDPLEANCEPALLGSLALLRLELVEPSRADAEVIATECLRIAHHVEGQERLGTATLYAIAASLAAPREAVPAYEAGRLAARWGDEVRAETWLRRAHALGRRSEDRGTYCRAVVALADLYAARGDTTRARDLYLAGARASRRYGMPALKGTVAFGLLRLAIVAGNRAEIDRLWNVVRRTFGRDHPRNPELVLEVARLEVDTGERQTAGEALRRLVPEVKSSEDRMAAFALIARADADPGTPWPVAETWQSALSLVEAHPASSARVRALVDLALAAVAVGSVERARSAYERLPPSDTEPANPLHRDVALVGNWLANQAGRLEHA